MFHRVPPSHPDDVTALPRSTTDDPWWPMWYEQVTGASIGENQAGRLRFDDQLLDGAAALAGHCAAMLDINLWQ